MNIRRAADVHNRAGGLRTPVPDESFAPHPSQGRGPAAVFYRLQSFSVHSEFYCRPHAEGAEDTENRRDAFLRVLHFSA
jgi:hypothetical protein